MIYVRTYVHTWNYHGDVIEFSALRTVVNPLMFRLIWNAAYYYTYICTLKWKSWYNVCITSRWYIHYIQHCNNTSTHFFKTFRDDMSFNTEVTNSTWILNFIYLILDSTFILWKFVITVINCIIYSNKLLYQWMYIILPFLLQKKCLEKSRCNQISW